MIPCAAPILSLLLALQVTPVLKQHVDAGLKAKHAGDLDTAIREFQRVVELAPKLPAAYVNLAAVYSEKKDYGNAIPPLRKALELNPDLPGAHGMLGVALLAQGYAAESIPHLEKANFGDLLGIALLESGRAREAIDKIEEAIEKRPGDPDLLYYLSRAHAQLAKQASQVLTADPDSARARQILGESRAAAGNRDLAEKDLRAALSLRPDLRGVHVALGDLYLGSGDFENAEREFREEIRLVPGSAAAAYKLGLVLLNRGQSREALAELRRADTLQPDSPEILMELGKAAAATGDSASAEKLFRRVLEQERGSSLAESAHFQLAQIYRKSGRTAEADRETHAFQEIRRLRQ